MTKELETAIALDPNFADAYMLLAFARMRAGDGAGALSSMQKAVALSPRNENYRFNLSQMYLNNQQPDQAVAILRMLQKSGNQEVAQRAGESLRQAQEFQAAMQTAPVLESAAGQGSAGEAPITGSVRIEKTSATDNDVQVIPQQTPVKFLKGTVQSVDCASPPAATLTIVSGTMTWKMQVSDSKHVLVIGADGFSCAWNRQKVALNYRETGDAAGSVISIEVQ